MTNRIIGFIDGPTNGTAERSPAQQEASRRNGAKSRGPITPEGRAKVSENALKHGLARRFIPPSDYRGDDRLYRRIHAELVSEFGPVMFTQRGLIDGLASDYIQLARSREMIEALHTPPTMPHPEREKWEQEQQTSADLQLIRRALRRSAGEPWPTYTARQSERLASLVSGRAAGLSDDLSEAEKAVAEAEAQEKEKKAFLTKVRTTTTEARPPQAGDSAAPAADEESEVGEAEFAATVAEENAADAREQLGSLREMIDFIGPSRRNLCRPAYVAAVLRGEIRCTNKLRERLRTLFERVTKSLEIVIHARQPILRLIETAKHNFVLRTANAPQQLILLERYVARIERAIERKLQQVRRQHE